MSEEAKTLEQTVGTKARYGGDFVLKEQVTHEAFTHVNASWLTKCKTFESMLKDAREFAERCEDIIGVGMKGVKFFGGEAKFGGKSYEIAPDALGQFCYYGEVPARYMTKLMELGNFGLFDANMNAGMLRASEDREAFMRTYKNGERRFLRAVLSDQYAVINNLPVIETLAELIPGGRVSHLRWDGDTFRANILIPDTMRTENDSDYGGGISVLNNETGRYPYLQRPFLFRAICFNGNVWDRADGFEFTRYHKGTIDWNDFREGVTLNLARQIPLVHENIMKVLALKDIGIRSDEQRQAIVHIGDVNRMSNKLCQAWHEGVKAEGWNSAFGLVQGLTRAAQLQTLTSQELMETLSTRLIEGNWDRLLSSARGVDESTVEKVLVLS